MVRQTAISLIGATIGVGLLGMSAATAAPANGAVIGKAASTEELTQKVVWRGGWRGAGWRGAGWGWGGGWRPGWRVGWGGWRPGWRAGWRGWGWRPGLAVA